jgi:hypothetical protein
MRILSLLLASILTACAPVATTPQPTPPSAPSSARVFFTAERVASGAVRLALDNGERHPIGYNLCNSDLERRTSSGWERVPTDDVCTMQLLTLNAGHDATFEKRLPTLLPAGEYRYVTGIESPLGTPQVRVATDPFSV